MRSSEPHLRHIRGPISEIRLKGKAGIARALYIADREQRRCAATPADSLREYPERRLVSLNFTSWNQIREWLRWVEALRYAP
jgi:hypothetical protein